MLIQATSWSHAMQGPSLLNGWEEGLGWGETVCVCILYIFVSVGVQYWLCIVSCFRALAVTETHIHSYNTLGWLWAEHTFHTYKQCILHPPIPTPPPPPVIYKHTHISPVPLTPTIHSPPGCKCGGSKRYSLLPLTLSLINNSYSWQMQRSRMKMAVCWPLWEGE